MVDPDSAEVTIDTLGDSNHGLDEWVALLRRWKIDIVVELAPPTLFP